MIAIVDTETGGTDAAEHALLEIAYAMVDVPSGKLIRCSSMLVLDPSREHGAEDVHGISKLLCEKGMHEEKALELLARALGGVDTFAYFADFDVQWLPGIALYDAADFELPRKSHSRKLVDVALAHGVGVTSAHRAIHDVLLVQQILERAVELGADLEAVVERAKRPKVFVASLAPFEQKEEVKAHGFRWEPERKMWTKKMFADEVASLPFETREI